MDTPHKNTITRRALAERTGVAWYSLLIEPERDESGNPVTIQAAYIGRDETANYFTTYEMPYADALKLRDSMRAHGYPPFLVPYTKTVDGEPQKVAALRVSLEKAQRLAADPALDSLSGETSLFTQACAAPDSITR
jgi:hypothetical protein